MLSPPGHQQQSPERTNALLLAFLNARRFPSSNPYGHQVLGGGRGGAFTTNALGSLGTVASGGSSGSTGNSSFIPLLFGQNE